MLYFIGIDISKFKHDIAAINSDGEVITPSWTFYNTDEGFSSLKKFLARISGEIRIGFESTSHYGQNLKLFLEANKNSGDLIKSSTSPLNKNNKIM